MFPSPGRRARRVLLLAPSAGLGGGIERYLSEVEASLRRCGQQVRRLDLYGPSRGGRWAQIEFVVRACACIAWWRPGRVFIMHRDLFPVGYWARAFRAHTTGWVYGGEVFSADGVARMRRAVRPLSHLGTISDYTAGALAPIAGRRTVTVVKPILGEQWWGLLARTPVARSRNPRIVAVSRLGTEIRDKGIWALVDLVADLRTEWPTLVLDVIGGGPALDACRARVRVLGLDGSCRFHGPVPDEALVRALREAWIFALPSRVDRGLGHGEGFGIVYIEAASAGLPVVGSTHGGAHEAVRDGVTGIAIDPDDRESLRAAAVRLLEDAPLRQRLGSAGEAWARAEFVVSRLDQEVRALPGANAAPAGPVQIPAYRRAAAKPSPGHGARRVVLDFSVVAPGGSMTYAIGFLRALGAIWPRTEAADTHLHVLLPRRSCLADQEAGLVEAGIVVRRVRSGSPGTWSGRLLPHLAVPWWALRLHATDVFVPRDLAPLLTPGRLTILVRNVLVWSKPVDHPDNAVLRLMRLGGRLSKLRRPVILVASASVGRLLPQSRQVPRVVHHGCDLPSADRSGKAPTAGDVLRVLGLGSIACHKRLDVLIDTVGTLNASGVAATLELWGPVQDVAEAGRLRARGLARLGADPLRGALPADARPGLFRAVDILMMGSATESFGLAMVEAMRTSTIVVAPHSDLLQEICGDCAVAYPEFDAPAAAAAIVRARSRFDTLAAQGQERAAELFTWERCVQDTLACVLALPAAHRLT